MVTAIACAIIAQRQLPGRHADPSQIVVGWLDEMDNRYNWAPLQMENRAFVAVPTPGTLFLGLDHTPPNWPYQFQWSGVTRDAYVDIARFPVATARVTQVQGYAHLDIQVIGPKGDVVNTLRTTTLTSPGISRLDLSKSLPAGSYRFHIRLIVGGPNEGCCATYDWLRFVTAKDADFLAKHPDWTNVRLVTGMLR